MYANAQIIFEQDYDSASTINSIIYQGSNQLFLVNFELSGYRYVKINRWSKSIQIYNLNHSLLKTIDCSLLPGDQGQLRNFIYFSEQLFNLDSKIEFMYGFAGSTSYPSYYTGIYNEDGALLFVDTLGVPIVSVNSPQQQFPIYNTPIGAKMILSYPDGHAKVFSLPGTLTTSVAEANNILIAQSSLSNPYPNPVSNTTKVDYKFPDGVNEGELVFYDLQGKEVKRYRVDRTFETLLISTSDIAAGTYFYQLQTEKEKSAGKKMIVIK